MIKHRNFIYSRCDCLKRSSRFAKSSAAETANGKRRYQALSESVNCQRLGVRDIQVQSLLGMTSLVAKRPSNNATAHDALVKRQKTEHELSLITPRRTSSLPAPTMLLSGHGAAVNVNRFNKDGTVLATGSFDKQAFLWRIADECSNYMVLKGHQGSITDLAWSCDSENIYTVGSDKVAVIYDAENGEQVRKLRDHRSFVNAVAASSSQPQVFVTAGDDSTVLLWDARSRSVQAQLNLELPVTSLALSKDDITVFAGGVDSTVTGWDLRNIQATYELVGPQDIVTGVSLSPDGAHLLVNAMDNVLRCYDVRPFCPTDRLVKCFMGATHDFEKNLLRCGWSGNGAQVTCGSADRCVHIWDTATTRIVYKLPGHKGSVNDVAFHPQEPVVASASSDSTIFIGELN